jgi:hypothetical protein
MPDEDVTDDLDPAKTDEDLEDLDGEAPKKGEDPDMIPDEEFLK